jgi:cysteine desulfuration protein SufE
MSIPEIPDQIRSSVKINSCTHNVWLYGYKENDLVYFLADSDSKIAKGLLAILINTFSGLNPTIIINGSIDFIQSIDFGSESLKLKAKELKNIFHLMQSLAQVH